MQNILLLGGFGFIGTNILSYIDENLKDAFQVIVFDKFPQHLCGFSFDCVKSVYAGDFADETCIERIFAENEIDIVIHLLSSTVPSTSNNAKYDVESNLVPTLSLLNIMSSHGVKDIVYMSSGGAVYGDFLKKAHSEEDAVYPKSSYGIVKLAIEKYMLSYSELYGFNTLILRLSNPYGKFHYNDRQGIINIAIRKALKGEKLQIWGSGNGIKDYIFIDDVCKILFRLIEKKFKANVINIASGNAYSVNEIAECVKRQIPDFVYEHVKESILDVQSFELDVTRLRRELGETYRFTPFDEGIQQTIEWQKNNL